MVVVGAQTFTATAIEVLSRLKAHPLCKHIPLLADRSPGRRGRGEPGGQAADKLLTCPVDLEEAKCALRGLFEQVDPTSDAAVTPTPCSPSPRKTTAQRGEQRRDQAVRKPDHDEEAARASPGAGD